MLFYGNFMSGPEQHYIDKFVRNRNAVRGDSKLELLSSFSFAYRNCFGENVPLFIPRWFF